MQTLRLNFAGTIEAGVTITGSARLLETVVQNLLDNAAELLAGRGDDRGRPARGGDVRRAHGRRSGTGRRGRRIFAHLRALRFLCAQAPEAGAWRREDRYRAASHFGLGLWIVRRNVEAMGGVVAAENRAQGGLPRRRGAAAPALTSLTRSNRRR